MRKRINVAFTDIKQHLVQYLVMILAIIGATYAPSLDAWWRGLGFFAWIFSNGVMLYEFIIIRNVPYSLLFIYYEISNVRGVFNNWYPGII